MQMTPMQRRFIRLSASFVVRDFDYWTLPSLVKGFVMEETFRLDLNKSWEAIDIKTGHAVLIPKGSHQAIRMLLKSPPDQTEENYLVVAVQDEGGQVLAGLREAYWRQWEGHYIPELRVAIREMKEKQHHPRKQRPRPVSTKNEAALSSGSRK